jgi:hypothetical protein
MRKGFSPVRLSLTIGLTAFAVAAAVTVGAEVAGDPVARVVLAPGVFFADLIESLWPGARGGGSSAELIRNCNIAVLGMVIFAVVRSWTFRRRRG